jgi:Zn finger protein HypA/HybF involved in hydrogenase expression
MVKSVQQRIHQVYSFLYELPATSTTRESVMNIYRPNGHNGHNKRNKHNGNNGLESVRAMLAQALAEARTRGAERVVGLHLVMYNRSSEAMETVHTALNTLVSGTPAEGAVLHTRQAPSLFICWNCCGLRFEAADEEAICPNCGSPGLIVPPDVTFALEQVDMA